MFYLVLTFSVYGVIIPLTVVMVNYNNHNTSFGLWYFTVKTFLLTGKNFYLKLTKTQTTVKEVRLCQTKIKVVDPLCR